MLEKKKPTEQELAQWLEGVHFGSCCRDPIEDKSTQENKKIKLEKPINDTDKLCILKDSAD